MTERLPELRFACAWIPPRTAFEDVQKATAKAFPQSEIAKASGGIIEITDPLEPPVNPWVAAKPDATIKSAVFVRRFADDSLLLGCVSPARRVVSRFQAVAWKTLHASPMGWADSELQDPVAFARAVEARLSASRRLGAGYGPNLVPWALEVRNDSLTAFFESEGAGRRQWVEFAGDIVEHAPGFARGDVVAAHVTAPDAGEVTMFSDGTGYVSVERAEAVPEIVASAGLMFDAAILS
ncbi:MAG: hypothetical protein HY875_10195 [Chloroflexi bacterium]|nr:hypothetical protein [Chloroflexota bacterium]